MSDDVRADHARWQELAVGHAVSALDPADDRAIQAHLEGCADCRALVGETERTMAELAGTVPAAAPPPGLRARILDAARRDDAGADDRQPTSLPPLPRTARWSRGPLRLAAAAAVVLLALVAVGTWRLLDGGPSGAARTVAERCAAVRCPTVPLTSGARVVADAMVLDDVVYLRPVQLPRNDAGRDEYVLWRLAPGTPPAVVGGFDVSGEGTDSVEVGRLAVPLSDVSQLAITREPGRVPPPAPTTAVVGAGAVT
ncbi:MAG: zf-HC2 domain-containing protein [Frankiaceae bacterium]